MDIVSNKVYTSIIKLLLLIILVSTFNIFRTTIVFSAYYYT